MHINNSAELPIPRQLPPDVVPFVDPAAARMFRLLSLPTGPDIGVGAAAALAGVSSAQARRLLDTLVGAHLLQESEPLGIWRDTDYPHGQAVVSERLGHPWPASGSPQPPRRLSRSLEVVPNAEYEAKPYRDS